jgi:hypothetical protein
LREKLFLTGRKMASLPGKAKRLWSVLRIRRFEAGINPRTRSSHGSIGEWAGQCLKKADGLTAEDLYLGSQDPVVSQGYRLLKQCLSDFKDKCVSLQNLRVLIHVPPPNFSPGGNSLFRNLAQGLEYLGIASKRLEWEDGFSEALEDFKPTVLITSDHPRYLERIDWEALKKYKSAHRLVAGLTASLEQYGNSPLKGRLDWARENGVDFYYSFRDQDYLLSREEYRPFKERGYRILTVEFGANPLLYHPVPGITRDLDYVFLASVNQDKWARYFSYLKEILADRYGYIDGPGWGFSQGPEIVQQRDKFLYARAKVGLNLHLQEQVDRPCELNERTYQLAACGIPQLLDDPALLGKRFGQECFFSAGSPEEYLELFGHILAHPDQAEARALNAQRKVFARHTTFHRAEQFARQLKEML